MKVSAGVLGWIAYLLTKKIIMIPCLVGEQRKEDERLFEEEYTKLRGEAENKYTHIPRFYSKVSRNVVDQATIILCVIIIYMYYVCLSLLVMIRYCSRNSEKMLGIQCGMYCLGECNWLTHTHTLP